MGPHDYVGKEQQQGMDHLSFLCIQNIQRPALPGCPAAKSRPPKSGVTLFFSGFPLRTQALPSLLLFLWPLPTHMESANSCTSSGWVSSGGRSDSECSRLGGALDT